MFKIVSMRESRHVIHDPAVVRTCSSLEAALKCVHHLIDKLDYSREDLCIPIREPQGRAAIVFGDEGERIWSKYAKNEGFLCVQSWQLDPCGHIKAVSRLTIRECERDWHSGELKENAPEHWDDEEVDLKLREVRPA